MVKKFILLILIFVFSFSFSFGVDFTSLPSFGVLSIAVSLFVVFVGLLF